MNCHDLSVVHLKSDQQKLLDSPAPACFNKNGTVQIRACCAIAMAFVVGCLREERRFIFDNAVICG